MSFDWTESCQESFEQLKQLLTQSPVLAFPNFEKDFLLETDASTSGLGAVLAQRQDDGKVRPVAYASRTLQAHEKNYGISELEALGVVWAVKHFRPYIYGHHCVVYTDHVALKALLNTPQPSGKLARWGMAIQELDLEIVHRSGKANTNADALSRNLLPLKDNSATAEVPFGIIAAIQPSCELDHLCLPELQREDSELSEIITYLETDVLPTDDKKAKELALTKQQYVLKNDVLYHVESDKTLRVIPPVGSRQQLVEEAHGGAFGGHLKEAKVHSQLSRHFWWPTMRRDITKRIRACLTCATRQPGRATKSPLTPIPVGGTFDRVGVDIIKFPTSYDGNQYAVVFVDYLSKWPEVFAVADQTAHTVATLLVEHVISRHGVPAELLSDRGQNFLSVLMAEVCTIMGIHQVNTTAYHPQTDGLVKRFHRTLTNMLAKVVERNGRDWDHHLPYVLFAYRTSVQASTGESPFFLMYGRDARLPTATDITAPTEREIVDLSDFGKSLMTNLSEARELAQKCIRNSQKKQKQNYDKRARANVFKVGERAFLYKPAAKSGKAYKFARPYCGPYRIVEITANDAKIRPIDRPSEEPIFVALDRLRRCPEEIGNEFWPTRAKKKAAHSLNSERAAESGDPVIAVPAPEQVSMDDARGVWSGRLRSHKCTNVGEDTSA